MAIANHYRSSVKVDSYIVRRNVNTQHGVRLRLKLVIPQHCQLDAVLSQLTTNYGLSVNCFGTTQETRNQLKQLSLELQGTIAQIAHALSSLESLGVVIKGRPNPDGDSWYY